MQYESLTAHMFDLDGTLVEGYMDRADRAFAPVSLLPGVLTKWKHLRQLTGNNLTIITNQGGVAFGYNTVGDVQRKLCAVGAALEYGWVEIHDGIGTDAIILDTGARNVAGVLQIYVCYADVRGKAPYNTPEAAARRKPSGTMIKEAFDGGYTQYRLFVGDRPEDEAAAKDAGVAFQWAKDFFNGKPESGRQHD